MNHILSLIFSSFAWRRLAKALVFAVLALSISACSSDDDDDDDANKAPTSNAGADQSVAEGTTGVTLDGSGSSDSDGTIEKYAWTLTTSNDDVTLTGADTATASFTAPDVDADTELVFRLTVTDNDGATDTDDVTITVTDSTSGGGGGENAAPTADAGADQSVLIGEPVTLNGSNSSDSDGTIEKYTWSHVTSNSGVDLSGEDTATASFTAPDVAEDTEMVFRLTVTDDDGATATDDVSVNVQVPVSSSQVLFASQYELIDGATDHPYAISEEDGDVYGFEGGDFYYTWGLGVADPNNGVEAGDYMQQRQAYGLQYNHVGAIDGNSYFGLAFKAPGSSFVDISGSDTMVIQTGNGAATDAFPNSHMVFTVELNGAGSSCSYDLTLEDGSRPASGETWANPYGIHTYRIPFGEDHLNCTDSLKAGLEEVAVKVVGGKDATASATENNQVLMQVGYIGFSNDTASVPGNGASNYLLFSSQYELTGNGAEPYAVSDEDGHVYSFSDPNGGFFYTWGLGESDPTNGVESGDYMLQRQAYGLQFNHTAAIDENSYFGLAFKAPDDSSLDVSGTDTLVIQTGNGAATDAFANSHMVYTLELNGGDSSCSYDLTLADGSRPSSGEAWTNPYGIHTYYVGLESFTCTSGDMDALTSDLEEVVVKVVGGKDATASATENNQVLLQVGYIAFAADDDDDE